MKLFHQVALIMNHVAISHGFDVIKTLMDSINKIGGMDTYIKKDSAVFIKPDLALPLGDPVTIQPLLLGNIVKACSNLGVKEISIGFNPFDGTSTKQVINLLGLDYYLKKLGATILNFENENYSSIKISNPIQFETLYIPEKLLQSDVFISLIAPRTDVYGKFALGLRNYFDLLNDRQKQLLYQSGSLNGLLDFYQIHPPHLAIWDAMVVGDGQGPFNQKIIPYNLILASNNLIAGDSVMAELMGVAPTQVEILKMAAEYKLGPIDVSDIKIIGEKINDHSKSVCKPSLSSKNASREFEIIEEKPCLGCQVWLRYFLDLLLRFCEKELEEFGGFTCFIGELSPKVTYSLKSGVILFGDCAISSNLEINFKDKNQRKKNFFKFPGCPPLNLRGIEKFCLDFKEWIPSLEIIEEFIRKWTIGRQVTKIPAKRNPK